MGIDDSDGAVPATSMLLSKSPEVLVLHYQGVCTKSEPFIGQVHGENLVLRKISQDRIPMYRDFARRPDDL